MKLTNHMKFLMPDVDQDNWPMTDSCKLALAGVLTCVKPRIALEIGVHRGVATNLLAKHAKKVVAIDPDPDVVNRYRKPSNVDLLIGDTIEMIDFALADFSRGDKPLEFILLDHDPSEDGAQRQLRSIFNYKPAAPLILMIHNTANPSCRLGVVGAPWHENVYVHSIDIDFVPGGIVEHTVGSGQPECWGGLGVAFMSPEPRSQDLVVNQGAYTSITTLHRAAERGSRRA
jgi:hypothetical protein